MIVKIGNMFETKAKTLVNTVNCVGVMGKGIAKEFKDKYPDMYGDYVLRCKNKEVRPGCPYLYENLLGDSIINFPTKDDWRSPSRLSYIVSGLDWFRNKYVELGIKSVAFPPLGCGNGGLSWSMVGPIMYAKLKDLPIDIEIYAPYGTSSEQMTDKFLTDNLIESENDFVGTKNLKLNKYWLLILYVIQNLNKNTYSLNVGRVIFQKICFALTREGIPTGFVFKEGNYGPYSSEVNNAIMVLSNANLMNEVRYGTRMIKTIVSNDFHLDYSNFTQSEIDKADRVVDLFSRIKSTDHAEMISTVLLTYDELSSGNKLVTEKQILEHILKWKPYWKDSKEFEITETIIGLSMLGWMSPDKNNDLLETDDDLI